MEFIQEADRSKWIAHSNHSIKCFTKVDIERMTNNYRTILGRGAFGEVYEGVLEDEKVAVKRLNGNVEQKFAKEFIVHREVNHKNVVRLIGYCAEENAFILVMEFITNGNMSDVLHGDNRPIPLYIRLRIAMECAEALAYMHSHMYTQVIHGDIKPGNILLDGNFHAKLSDFGISRLANTDNGTLKTENVIGSIGYMDPLFSLDGLITVKYDVYSFGAVLVELITRKKAVVDNVNNVYAFTNALTRGIRGVKEMFDVDIASKNNMKVLEGVAKLAGDCLRMDRDKRPEMIDVAERLRMLRKDSHQNQRQRAFTFSWVRKSNPAPPSLVNIPANNFFLEKTSIDVSSIKRILANSMLSDVYRRFSFAEIKAGTNNFDESLLIEEDMSGKVYCCQIDGRKNKVAIKDFQNGLYELYTEITIHQHRHNHLVAMIGYCIEKDEMMILVYDYMARGSLRDHLYLTQKTPLSWKRRIEICIGAARGLHYLHELQIIHRNVTTRKILLDEEWVAKITDLSLSKTGTLFETRVLGTYGYVDPEYMMTCWLTQKSDVYSFGVVLLEVLCAKPAWDKSEQIMLANKALRCMKGNWFLLKEKKWGNLDQITDPYLRGRINPMSLNTFAEIALKCLADKGGDRPSMGDVLSGLEYALELHDASGEASSSGGTW